MAYDPSTAGEHLPAIIGAIDALLQETFGQKLHIVMIVGDGEQASIASNTSPVKMLTMMEAASEPLKAIPPEMSEAIEAMQKAQQEARDGAGEQKH